MTKTYKKPLLEEMGSRVITGDDVVRAGACSGGVRSFIERYKDIAAAVPVAIALKLAESDEERAWIHRAADFDGNGYGYGDGGSYL